MILELVKRSFAFTLRLCRFGGRPLIELREKPRDFDLTITREKTVSGFIHNLRLHSSRYVENFGSLYAHLV